MPPDHHPDLPAVPEASGHPNDVLTVMSACDDLAATLAAIIARDYPENPAAVVFDILRGDLFEFCQRAKDLFKPLTEAEHEAVRAVLREYVEKEGEGV